MDFVKKIILVIIFLFSATQVMGQGFSYTFTDPCTFKQKQIYINSPTGSVTLTYNGNIRNFTQSELSSGFLEQWVNEVNSQNSGGPCSGVGLIQNTTMNALIAQNNIAVLTNVMSALNDISSFGGTSVGGIVEAKEKSASNDNKRNNNNNNTTTPTNNNTTPNPNNGNGGSTQSNPQVVSSPTNGGQTTNGQNTTNTGSSTINSQTQNNGTTTNNGGSTITSGGNQTNQTTQTNSGVNPNPGGTTQNQGGTTPTTGGSTTTTNNTTQGGGQTTQPTLNGGKNGQTNNSSNSEPTKEDELSPQGGIDVRGSSSAKEKVANAKQGGIVLNGDIVLISSATPNEPQQFRMNVSVVKSNTNNTLVKGALFNFTTSINNSNMTLFVGKKIKNFTGIVANSSMLNFQKDFFNTTSLMGSYKYKKVTSTLGVNFTTGNLGDSRFQSLSALGGVVGTFNLGKKMTNTTMLVTVYSPFVYYYEGLWYKSGWLAVPFTAFDYKITQKFKLNLSFSGIQQIKDATLNYQVLLGAKALL